jgi:hypothetical protein
MAACGPRHGASPTASAPGASVGKPASPAAAPERWLPDLFFGTRTVYDPALFDDPRARALFEDQDEPFGVPLHVSGIDAFDLVAAPVDEEAILRFLPRRSALGEAVEPYAEADFVAAEALPSARRLRVREGFRPGDSARILLARDRDAAHDAASEERPLDVRGLFEGPYVLLLARYRDGAGLERYRGAVLSRTPLAISLRLSPFGSVVWVTDVRGGVVAGAAVSIRSRDGRVRFEGRTGPDGTVTIPKGEYDPIVAKTRGKDGNAPARALDEDAAVFVQKGGARAFVPIAGESAEPIPAQFETSLETRGALLTDRTRYAVGEAWHAVGIFRRASERGYDTPAGEEADVEVRGWDDDAIVLQERVKLDAFGMFATTMRGRRDEGCLVVRAALGSGMREPASSVVCFEEPSPPPFFLAVDPLPVAPGDAVVRFRVEAHARTPTAALPARVHAFVTCIDALPDATDPDGHRHFDAPGRCLHAKPIDGARDLNRSVTTLEVPIPSAPRRAMTFRAYVTAGTPSNETVEASATTTVPAELPERSTDAKVLGASDPFDELTLHFDRAAYRVGDVARVDVRNPLPGGDALLVVQREGVLHARHLPKLPQRSTLDVPIDASFAPNAFLSLEVARGYDHSPALAQAARAPRSALSVMPLRVRMADEKLDVRLALDARTSRVRIRVLDPHGRAVRAMLSILVVDAQFAPDAPNVRALFDEEPRPNSVTAREGLRAFVVPYHDGGPATSDMGFVPFATYGTFGRRAGRPTLAADATRLFVRRVAEHGEATVAIPRPTGTAQGRGARWLVRVFAASAGQRLGFGELAFDGLARADAP